MRRLAGIDVGGTFTDLAIWDGDSRSLTLHKLLSTPEDPPRAMREGLEAAGFAPDAIVHATTLVTNALIERKGMRTGLITTEGYRDVIEIGKELRYDPFDLMLKLPETLVPRERRLCVRERIGAAGEVVVPLDEQAVISAGTELVRNGVESVAVAFYNSYKNPMHEARAAQLLRDSFPELAVCTSSEIAPEIREFQRFSTAVANAYIQPIVSDYLIRLEKQLGKLLFVMLSDGGITSARAAAAHPISMVESGPAAGVMGAAHLARIGEWHNVIAFDMGGTTAKISLVVGGKPEVVHELEVARIERFKKGSGLPVRIPVVELMEVGAGGGSIAWVNELGLIQVGPRSAGASPGPACYGLGGADPTVTDADLRLGYLNPDNFCGGQMALDVAAGDGALTGLGTTLNMDETKVAYGIVEVVNNNMAAAAQVHIAEKGADPRRFSMVAFGGAGPVHAYEIARILRVPKVIFPRGAGVASAIGMLVAPRSTELSRSLLFGLESPKWNELDTVLTELRGRAVKLMRDAGVRENELSFEVSSEMRYRGQGYEINVLIPEATMHDHDTTGLSEVFRTEYARRFGRSLNMPAEAVSWRVRASAAPAIADFEPSVGGCGGNNNSAQVGHRPVFFPEMGKFVDSLVFERERIKLGDMLHGPAVIEEAGSTIVVGPSGGIRMDPQGNLIMSMMYDDDPH